MIWLLTISLLWVALQDFKSRQVYILAFAVSGLIFGAQAIMAIGWSSWGLHLLINTSFLLIQLLAIWILYRLRFGKWSGMFDVYLGWGDVVFFAVLAVGMSPMTFVVFYVGSVFVSLVWGMVGNAFQQSFKVPLAGVQALCLVFFVWMAELTSVAQLTNDLWIISYLR